MKRAKWIKKSLLILMTASLVAATLTGCGKGSAGNNSPVKVDAEQLKQMVYSGQEMPGVNEMEGNLGRYCVEGDTLFIYNSKWESEEENQIMPKDLEVDEQTMEDEADSAALEGEDAPDIDENDEDFALEAAAEEAVENDEETEGDESAETDTAEGEEENDAESSEDAESEEVNEDDVAVDEMPVEDTDMEDIGYSDTEEYIYTMKSDGSEFTKIYQNTIPGKDGEFLNCMDVSQDEFIYLLYSKYEYDETKGTDNTYYTLRIMDKSGNIKQTQDMSDLLSGDDTYLYDMKVADDGNLYFLMDSKVIVCDINVEKQFDVQFDGWGCGIVETNDSRALVCFSGENGYEIRPIDVANKSFGDKLELDSDYSVNQIYDGNGDYLFYLISGNRLRGYKASEKKFVDIIDWVSSNLNPGNISDVRAIGDEFIGSYYDYMAEESQTVLYRFTKVDPSTITSKETITYTGMYVDDDIRSQAVKFNKSQDKYQVYITDYSTCEQPDVAMQTDILAGNVPDIIDLSGLDAQKLIAKGLLVDLYSFLDQDAELSRDDFLPQPLKAMETDGKLYQVAPDYGINALISKKSTFNDKDFVSVKDLADAENGSNGVKAFYMRSNADMVTSIVANNYTSYIDYTNGKCNFDSDEFINLLEYAKSYPNEVNYDEDGEDYTTMLRNGKLLFADSYYIGAEDIELYEAIFEGDLKFYGYPSNEYQGLGISMNRQLGICSKSKDKEGAWAFLRSFLTDEYSSGSSFRRMGGGLPLNKESFEAVVKRYTATEAYTDKYGHQIDPYESSWGMDGLEVEIVPLNKEQEAILRSLVDQVTHVITYDNNVNTILEEECGAFFSGAKSAKEVAGIIQNRISTYVNENR